MRFVAQQIVAVCCVEKMLLPVAAAGRRVALRVLSGGCGGSCAVGHDIGARRFGAGGGGHTKRKARGSMLRASADTLAAIAVVTLIGAVLAAFMMPYGSGHPSSNVRHA